MILTSPFPRENLDLLWGWLAAWQKSTLDDMSPQTLRELREKYDRDAVAGMESFGIYLDPQADPVGIAWFDNLGTGIYMGHVAFEDKALKPAEKRLAMQMALAYMFNDGRARKVSWVVYRDNFLFLRFLRNIGAIEEGVLRRHVARGEDFVDSVLLASFPREVLQT